eukprot:EG_transcript_38395
MWRRETAKGSMAAGDSVGAGPAGPQSTRSFFPAGSSREGTGLEDSRMVPALLPRPGAVTIWMSSLSSRPDWRASSSRSRTSFSNISAAFLSVAPASDLQNVISDW